MGKIIDYKNIGRLIDVSTVKPDVTFNEVNQMINIVKKYNCVCASPMPYFTKYTVNNLKDRPDIVTTGVVGFPSGADTTFIKVAETKELISFGCEEIDMVINISAFKSGMYSSVKEDIKAVVDAANGYHVKTILEVCYLTDDEIRRACEICVNAGAKYIKTGTGWGSRPTTIHDIKLIRSTIENSAKIKAAGGIRTLDTLVKMYEAGCDRFGIGVRSASLILSEAANKNI